MKKGDILSGGEAGALAGDRRCGVALTIDVAAVVREALGRQ